MKVNLTAAQAEALLAAAALHEATPRGGDVAEDRARDRHLKAATERIAEALYASAIKRGTVERGRDA